MRFIIQVHSGFIIRYVKILTSTCVYIDTWETKAEATRFNDWDNADLVHRFLNLQGIEAVIRECDE